MIKNDKKRIDMEEKKMEEQKVEEMPVETKEEATESKETEDQGFFGGKYDDDKAKEKPYVNVLSTVFGLVGLAIAAISLFVFKYIAFVGLGFGVAGLVLEVIKEKKQKRYDVQAFLYSLVGIVIAFIGIILFIVYLVK